MRTTRRFLLTWLVIILLGGGSFMLYDSSSPEARQPTASTVPALSRTQILALQNDLIALVKSAGARTAIDELKLRSAENPSILRECHPLIHEIGRVAFSVSPDIASSFASGDEWCTSGYYHGVIQAAFQKTPNPLSAMTKSCASYPDGSFASWECFHGIGHGLMYYTENDLPHSLQLCATEKNPLATDACVNGVFMENFTADDDLHPTVWRKKDDLFYPCAIESAAYQEECYLNIPQWYLTVNPNAYLDGFSWCRSAGNFEQSCVRGIVRQAIRDNLANPSFVEGICDRTPYRNACVEEMANIFVSHAGKLSVGPDFCASLEKNHRSACFEKLKELADMFSK